MATRSTTSGYYPAPPVNRLNSGKVGARVAIKTPSSNTGVKNNMCVAPATNGERAMGKVAPSQPASSKKGMGISATIAG
jgi:hypothetical protein